MHRRATLFFTAMLLLIASSARAADPITSAIDDLSPKKLRAVRLAALKLLRDSNEDARALAAIEPLKAACEEEDEELRYYAVIALGLLCWNQEQPGPMELVEAMFDPSARIRTNAAAIVPEVGKFPAEAIPLILKGAAHPNPEMRSAAVQALAHPAQKDSKLLAVLCQAAYDRDVSVRSNAAAALFKATDDLSQVVPYWLLLTWDAEKPEEEDEEGIPVTAANLAALGAMMMLNENGIKRPHEVCDVLVKLVDSDQPTLRCTATLNLRAMAISSAESKRVLIAQGVPDLLRKLREDTDLKVATFASLGLEEFEKEGSTEDD